MSRITRRSILPVNQVVPLTHRDGVSLLEMIEDISRYIKSQLHPSLQSVVDDIAAEAERLLDESHDRFVDGVQEFQRIHDAFLSDVNAKLMALNDTAVSDLIDDETSLLGTIVRDKFASRQRVNERSIVPQDFGAVADWEGTTGTDNTGWDGTTGTDNAAAFQAAIDAAGDGGTVVVPAGEYYLGSTLHITKSITLTTGGGGDIVSGQHGTRLWFAPGITGIQIGEGGEATSSRPTHWKIGPLNIRSLSTGPNEGYGVLIRAGRGIMEQTNIESFGSHGVYAVAGRDYDAGNANNNIFIGVRAYRNYGDGIRLEGTDANACMLMKPNVVANRGWGINLQSAAMTMVFTPHADQQYGDSPGAFRDSGNSNHWLQVYSEGAAPFHIGSTASSGLMTSGAYGNPQVTSDTNGVLNTYQVSNGVANTQNFVRMQHPLDDSSDRLWEFRVNNIPGSSLDGTLSFRHYQFGQLWRVSPEATSVTHFVDQYPSSGASLGSLSSRWNEIHGSTIRAYDTLRVGSLYLRANGGQLEVSANGTTWRTVATE